MYIYFPKSRFGNTDYKYILHTYIQMLIHCRLLFLKFPHKDS